MSKLTDRVSSLLPDSRLAKIDGDNERDIIIWGPPGTGKTTSLLTLVEAHLTAECSPSEMLIATFTRNARKELVSRLTQKFRLEADDLPWVRTIHSTAYRLLELSPERVMSPFLLKGFGLEYGYVFEGILIQRTIDDPYGTSSIQTFGDWCYVAEELRRAKMLDFDGIVRELRYRVPDEARGWDEREAEKFATCYREFKAANGLLDFSDMLEAVLRERLRPPVNWMFIDESQDLTALQWAVIDLWARDAIRLFIFGDDDQAIYAFAGADPSALWRRPGHQFVLAHSYRLLSNIHAYANVIIKRTRQRVEKEFEPHGEGGEVRATWSWSQLDMDREGTHLLLARNRWFLGEARDALHDKGVPFIDRTSRAGIPEHNSPLGRALFTLMELHAGRLIQKGQARNLRNQVAAEKYWPTAKETKLTIFGITDLLDFGATPEMVNLIANDPLRVLKLTLNEYDYLRAVFTRHGMAGLTSPPRIELATIHGVKGEQAHHVSVSTGMTRKTFEGYESNPDEEHRVFYVAATRAQSSLTWIESGRMNYRR